jgi:hypothetical protein
LTKLKVSNGAIFNHFVDGLYLGERDFGIDLVAELEQSLIANGLRCVASLDRCTPRYLQN